MTVDLNNNPFSFWVSPKGINFAADRIGFSKSFMPKLTTTRTRIADLGKPRIVAIDEGFGELEIAKELDDLKAQTILLDKYNHHCNRPLLLWMFICLTSFARFNNKLFVLFAWSWSYLSHEKNNRLIITRPKDGVN